MIWKLECRKQAYEFLKKKGVFEKVEMKIIEYIRGEKQDIKRLKGNWKDFLRLRVGKIRVIFQIGAHSVRAIFPSGQHLFTKMLGRIGFNSLSESSILFRRIRCCWNFNLLKFQYDKIDLDNQVVAIVKAGFRGKIYK